MPDDVSVVGVDNDDITCALAQPALTSIGMRLEEIGYGAAEHLSILLDTPPNDGAGERRSVPRHQTVPPGRLIERDSSRIFPTTDPFVKRALEFIYSAADSFTSVPDVARRVALSRRSLELRFKRETGAALQKTITKVRMLRACELLRETNDKITAVASGAGFNSVQRFFELFRLQLGMTPLEYRELADAAEARIFHESTNCANPYRSDAFCELTWFQRRSTLVAYQEFI